MRVVLFAFGLLLGTCYVLAQDEAFHAPDTTSKVGFVTDYYFNLQGGLAFYNAGYIVADGDLRLYVGRKVAKYLNPGLVIGYDAYAITDYNLVPVELNLRFPLTEQFYLNLEGGYGIPIPGKFLDNASYHGEGGFATGISIGSFAGSGSLKWHFSMGYKHQRTAEEWYPWWSEFPRKNTYRLNRIFVRVGIGI